jgi:hypothetical protein
MKRLRAFPLNVNAKSMMTAEEIATYRVGNEAVFDPKFYWRPISDRTGNILMNMWKAAVDKRASAH